MERRALMQLAFVAASLTTISAFLLFGAYRKRRLSDAEDRALEHARRASAGAKDAAGPAHAAAPHGAPKPPKAEPAPVPAAQKKVEPEPAATPPPVNVGQEEATLATKKYKAGAYEEAVELYSLAIAKCEQAEPLDVRNVKVMYSNRAAAYEKLARHQSVIGDCSKALKLDNRHPKSYLRRAKAKAAVGDLEGSLVDYVCLLVISEEKQEQVDEQLAVEISRIHSAITEKEIEDMQQNKQNPKRYLPDQFFVTSYYSSFHPSDDENDLVATKSSDEYASELAALGKGKNTREKRGELMTLRALALKQEKQYDAAAKEFDAACKVVNSEDAAFYTAQIENGTYHHLRGEFELAKQCFEAALEKKPQSIFAKIRMGGLCFDQKDLPKALEWFDMALVEKPECSTAYFHRGQLHSIDLSGNGQDASTSLAFKDLEKCISISPDFSMAYIQLGVTHARHGNFDGAVEYLRTAARITPDVPEIYNYLGETYMQMLQMPGSQVALETVEEAFEKAIVLDPSYPMAYINQGNLLVQKGPEFGHQALALFEKAVEMCPRSKFAYCHLAQVYLAMQEYARAIEQIDRAVAFAFSKDELTELFAIRVTAETHQKAQVLLN
jgi:import receptor subunit TOM70